MEVEAVDLSMSDHEEDDIHGEGEPHLHTPPPEAAIEHSNVTMMSGYKVVFPPGKSPFPSQLAVMSKILQAIRQRKNALLESPTGTGKTLALLCAALAFQKQERLDIANGVMIEAAELAKQQAQAAAAGLLPPPPPPSQVSAKKAVELKLEEDEYNSPDTDDDNDFESSAAAAYRKLKPSKKEKEVAPSCGGSSCGGGGCADANAEGVPAPGTQKAQAPPGPRKKEKLPVIIFCSRTHSQLSQVVGELKTCGFLNHHAVNMINPTPTSTESACMTNTGAAAQSLPGPFKMTLLASRQNTCINRHARAATDVNEGCREQLKHNSCSEKRRAPGLVRRMPPVWDVEDLVAEGKMNNMCPYFAAKEALNDAHLVFAPYQYITDPITRRIMKINLTNSIVIFDEAHNLEDVCRSAGSAKLSESSLATTAQLLDLAATSVKTPREEQEACRLLHKTVAGVGSWLKVAASQLSRSNFEKEEQVWDGVAALAILQERGHIKEDTLPSLELAVELLAKASEDPSDQEFPGGNEQERTHKVSPAMLGVISSLITVVGFMLGKKAANASHYKMAIQKEANREWNSGGARGGRGTGRFGSRFGRDPAEESGMQTYLCLWCLSASVCFSDIEEKARSVILTSGTLSPMDSFAGELGTSFPIRLEANHVIDVKKQCFVGSIASCDGFSLNAAYQNQSLTQYQDALGSTILKYAEIVQGGLLVFFPSYTLLSKVYQRWEMTGQLTQMEEIKAVLQEPRKAGEIDYVLEDFNRAIEDARGAAAGTSAQEAWGAIEARNRGGGMRRRTGAILLAVCRGKVSEGLDFSDDYARLVIVVGIPYPSYQDLLVKEKRKYQDVQHRKDPTHLRGDDWYAQQAFRALNQAIGRCIRHRKDHGAIILCDPRYKTTKGAQENLSKWVRNQVRHYQTVESTVEHVKTFYTNQDPMDPETLASLKSKTATQPKGKTPAASKAARRHSTGASLMVREEMKPLPGPSLTASGARVDCTYPVGPFEQKPRTQEVYGNFNARSSYEGSMMMMRPPSAMPIPPRTLELTSPVVVANSVTQGHRQYGSGPDYLRNWKLRDPSVPYTEAPVRITCMDGHVLLDDATPQKITTPALRFPYIASMVASTETGGSQVILERLRSRFAQQQEIGHVSVADEVLEVPLCTANPSLQPAYKGSESNIWISEDSLGYTPMFCTHCVPHKYVGLAIPNAGPDRNELTGSLWLQLNAVMTSLAGMEPAMSSQHLMQVENSSVDSKVEMQEDNDDDDVVFVGDTHGLKRRRENIDE